jgi:hypothetical protein
LIWATPGLGLVSAVALAWPGGLRCPEALPGGVARRLVLVWLPGSGHRRSVCPARWGVRLRERGAQGHCWGECPRMGVAGRA